MTVGSRKILSMMAQITRGVRKTDSHLVTDAETSKEWDELAAAEAKRKVQYPGTGVDLPSDPDF